MNLNAMGGQYGFSQIMGSMGETKLWAVWVKPNYGQYG